jgi:hypothetical protein
MCRHRYAVVEKSVIDPILIYLIHTLHEGGQNDHNLPGHTISYNQKIIIGQTRAYDEAFLLQGSALQGHSNVCWPVKQHDT